MIKRNLTEIFVFGSNLSGIHGAGAALHAKKYYGAKVGIGEGITGNSYAIPTKGRIGKDKKFPILPLDQVEFSLERFIRYAKKQSYLEEPSLFLLTPIGTGLAGHNKKDIWNILKKHYIPNNVVLTKSWIK